MKLLDDSWERNEHFSFFQSRRNPCFSISFSANVTNVCALKLQNGFRFTDCIYFAAMLAAARSGQIDLILTKSISRFARNTVDLLETIRALKTLGVEVRFEKENISTFSADGELVLTLLASFAQAESEQISQNVKWRVRKGFEQGKANGFHLYGYADSPDATDVEIVEDEPEVAYATAGEPETKVVKKVVRKKAE